MITTIFSKSNPLNYILITGLLVLFFFLLQIQDVTWMDSTAKLAKKGVLLALLIASLFVTNFVIKRNGMSKDSTFAFFFFFLFVILFPTSLNNTSLIIANFFILLAFRRLISLQSLLTPKEKIFDASLWIFVAALFHFWSIIFIVLVFFSIILHVSRDYRIWILPYIAFVTVTVIFVFFALIFDKSLIAQTLDGAVVNLKFDYFTNTYQNIALSIYAAFAVLFLFTQVFSLSNKSLILHSSYKKIILGFVIAIIIFVISPDKSNSVLIYTFMPLAVMATNYIEGEEVKWVKETTTILITIFCLLSFFLQL